jgi:uncharacterized protein (TIGR01777 family)
MAELIARSHVDDSAEVVFAWHERPGAFERLSPPWEPAQVIARQGTIHDGDRTVLRVKVGPLEREWEALHGSFVPGRQFVDEQVRGPFRAWKHLHRFQPDASGCRVEDCVEYELPLGRLGRGVAGRRVRARLQRMFTYRHAVLAADLERHRGVKPLRIAISGASGLIGNALRAFLSTGGHEVVPLVRAWPAGEGAIYWDPDRGAIDAAALEGFDAVVHLAGENVGARWTDERKQRIRDSRVKGTRLVAETLARLERPPRVLVSASAIGLYGDHESDRLIDEEAPAGDGFLAEVCRAWEGAAQAAARRDIRVVHPRLGVVLTPAGGALERLLPIFAAGLGGRVGSGRQGMSWIALDDVLYAIYRLITDESITGPVNVVAPQPVTNAELTHTLGAVLGRPTALPLPASAVTLGFGEMGRSVLLGGALVVPRRLLDAGHAFAHPSLEGALRHLLGRDAPAPPSFAVEVTR